MNKNRTWVEEGDYSIPTKQKSSGAKKRLYAALCLAPLYYLVSNYLLVIYWCRLFKCSYPTGLSSLFWGWQMFVAVLKRYGINSKSNTIAFVLVVIFIFFVVALRLLFDTRLKNSDMVDLLHGSSHWAKEDEIRRAGLLSCPNGAVVGGWVKSRISMLDVFRNRNTFAQFLHGSVTYYLRHSGPEHILAVAPTRSGKGVGLVVPTLLTWTESVFVLDIKGENWLLSAGWREKNIGPCLRFEPTDPTDSCAKYNPLAEVNVGTPNETREIQNIATLIVDPDGKGLEDYWAKTAFELLTGAITHEIYKAHVEGTVPTLKNVRDSISSGDIQGSLEEWRQYHHTSAGVHPIVESVANSMSQKADKELSGVYSTANAALNLWLDPVITKNTSSSTFHITDMVNSEKPLSVYVVVPPSDLVRLRPILRLFVTQIVFTLTQKMEVKNGGVAAPHKHKILLMLDEFPQLRKLDLLESALAFMGGYGVKGYIICQSYKQLTDIYGKDETVSSNCHLQICYAPNDEDTAKIVSEKCGKTTVTLGSSNISGSRYSIGPFGKNNESESYQQQQRELLYPDETKRLPTAVKDGNGRVVEPGDLLLFVSGTAPIYGRQTPFFLDSTFDARAKISPPQTIFFKMPEVEPVEKKDYPDELKSVFEPADETKDTSDIDELPAPDEGGADSDFTEQDSIFTPGGPKDITEGVAHSSGVDEDEKDDDHDDD